MTEPVRSKARSVRCSSCRGKCRWVDTAWVCTKCGDEWFPDHNPVEFAPPDGIVIPQFSGLMDNLQGD